MDKNLDHFFNNLKCALKAILAFAFILRKLEEEGSDILRTRKQYPAGPIPTCVHMGELGKT